MDTEQFRFSEGTVVTEMPTLFQVDDPKQQLQDYVERFSDAQELLFADARQSLLLVFQGMDAAGKDSTIKKVTSGVNPQGFQVTGFKRPTHLDLAHNYLWRCWRAVPERGRIGVFNRSHYEEVLVVRVHPEILDSRSLPERSFGSEFWRHRYDDINSFEAHLHRNGTHVVKFFLNVSKEEQRQRLLSRLDTPKKWWKFNPSDLDERACWDDYMRCYQWALEATSTQDSPWYVIPADDKPSMRVLVAAIIVELLEGMEISFPAPSEAQTSRFDWARSVLEDEAKG